MSDYIGDDPRLAGLRVEPQDNVMDEWTLFNIYERDGTLLTPGGVDEKQVSMLLNRMRTVQVLP